VIPLGIDTKTFYPYEQEDAGEDPFVAGCKRAKRQLKLFAEEDLNTSFLVLNANRNQPRKRIDITMLGFSLFARGKPQNVQLYLHMGNEDMGWNILKLAKRLGIDDRLILTVNDGSIPGIPDDGMNAIYNACDVGINTSTCEGWGLPNFEHAAVRRAQV